MGLYIPSPLDYPFMKTHHNPGPMAFTLALLTFLIAVLIPGEALAWGIGVHLQIGSHILGNLHMLPSSLKLLLTAFPHDFLYGCIAADITLGKKFTHYLNHCHGWRIGRRVLDAARSDSQKACAYGYLCHLAADSVAHSYYVPYKMVRTFNTVFLQHAYWEMRFEADVDPDIWPLARTIARKNFEDNDALLRSVLSDTIFSFSTNKRLFNSLLLLSRLQQYQKMLRSLSTNSRFVLEPHDRDDFYNLARGASESLLAEMEKSPYWSADPTGERALQTAKLIRKNLHLLLLDGKLSESDAEPILADLKGRFREAIVQPDRLLELLSGY